MGIRIVSLSLAPKELLELLMGEIDGDLIHQSYHRLDKGRSFGNLVLERFYPTENHQRMLAVHTENIKGVTNGTIITSSNPEVWRFQPDWDEEDNFMNEVMEIIDEYIIEEEEA